MDSEDQPRVQAPQDPFGPQHANFVQILETLRAYRRAGGGLIESAVMVAAQLAVLGAGGEAQGGQQ